MNVHYIRVIPRDLFNEAKLLKCMGRLSLLIHDCDTPCQMEMYMTGDAEFRIALMDEGSLTVINVLVTIKGHSFVFKTTYNAKDSYPFYVEYDNCDYRVFDEAGNWHEEFLAFVKTI